MPLPTLPPIVTADNPQDLDDALTYAATHAVGRGRWQQHGIVSAAAARAALAASTEPSSLRFIPLD